MDCKNNLECTEHHRLLSNSVIVSEVHFGQQLKFLQLHQSSWINFLFVFPPSKEGTEVREQPSSSYMPTVLRLKNDLDDSVSLLSCNGALKVE